MEKRQSFTGDLKTLGDKRRRGVREAHDYDGFIGLYDSDDLRMMTCN